MSRIIKRIITHAAKKGLDLNVKDNIRSILKYLGVDPIHVDRIQIELRNEVDKDKFQKTDANSRILILPQCLRKLEKCTAKATPIGLRCNNCGAKCLAWQLNNHALRLGYQGVYISPGGSMAIKIVEEAKPQAIVAVACFRELNEAVSRAKEHRMDKIICAQLIPLTKNGCYNTEVDAESVINTLSLGLSSMDTKTDSQVESIVPKKVIEEK